MVIPKALLITPFEICGLLMVDQRMHLSLVACAVDKILNLMKCENPHVLMHVDMCIGKIINTNSSAKPVPPFLPEQNLGTPLRFSVP